MGTATATEIRDMEIDRLGFGELVPFIKLGYQSLNSNRQELNSLIVELSNETVGAKVLGCSRLPSIGEYGDPQAEQPEFEPERLVELMRKFNDLIGRSGGPNGENGFDGLRRVFATVNLVHRQFNEFRQYTRQIPKETSFSSL